MPADALRFTDILTMAASVASYLAVPDVTPRHLLDALDILEGRVRLEDLGRMRSPLVPVAPAQYGGAEPAVRELTQRWFEHLHSDPEATLASNELAAFRHEVEGLAAAGA
jgi:hypothetical protein